jgi:hypothetical protein
MASAPGGHSIKCPNCGNAPVGCNTKWHSMSTEIFPNKKMIPTGLIICIFVCALSFLGFEKIKVSNSIDQTYIRYLMISLFILGIYYGTISLFGYLRFLFSSKAKITIDKEGITDNLTLVSFGKIEWREVKNIRIENAYNFKFLVIEIANPESFLNKQPRRKQKMLKSVLKKFGSPTVIPGNKINCSLESVESEIRKYKASAY